MLIVFDHHEHPIDRSDIAPNDHALPDYTGDET